MNALCAAIRQREETIADQQATMELLHTIRPLARMNHFAVRSIVETNDARKHLGLARGSKIGAGFCSLLLARAHRPLVAESRDGKTATPEHTAIIPELEHTRSASSRTDLCASYSPRSSYRKTACVDEGHPRAPDRTGNFQGMLRFRSLYIENEMLQDTIAATHNSELLAFYLDLQALKKVGAMWRFAALSLCEFACLLVPAQT